MSLWLNRRRIVRAVAGLLPVAREQRLRAHLVGCEACRRYYDQVSLAAEAFGSATSQRRERDRLLAGLDAPAPVATPSPRPRRAVIPRLAPAALLVAAAAGIVLWRLPARQTEDGITWRGPAGRDDERAPVRLLLHASRKGEGGTRPGPLRFIANLPGAGEGKVSVRDYLQLSYVGLAAPAYATVVAIDEAGGAHAYVPRPDALPLKVEPSARARSLGPSVDLGRQRPGRFRLYAVFASAPVSEATIRAAAARAQASGKPAALEGVSATQVSGVLIVEP